MNAIPTGTIGLVICDLPFGCTQNEWDKPIDNTEMWKQLNRVTRENAAVILMGVNPFFSSLVQSNSEDFRYEMIWKPKEKGNFLNANRMPLRQHINIGVWYRKLPVYNPQKTEGHKPVNSYTKHSSDGSNYGKISIGISGGGQTDRFPTTIIDIPYKTITSNDRLHPTQKPVELYEWFIKTFSVPGDIVLDFAAGSGTAAVAAKNTGRNFICIEKEYAYYEKAIERIG